MSFKDAFGKAKGKSKKKPATPIDAVMGDGREIADENGAPTKKTGKKGGFAEAAKNAKKKKSKK